MLTHTTRGTVVAATLGAALYVALPAAPCAAATVNVPPGIGTLQAAIDAAAPGDELILATGVYTGPVVVNKHLSIYCYADPSGTCVIDGNCAAPVAFRIAADGVKVETRTGGGYMRIIRGTHTYLSIESSTAVKLDTLQLSESLLEAACGTEMYSLEIAASSKIKVKRTSAGFGVYIHDVPASSRVAFRRSDAGNGGGDGAQAVLIENSGAGAELGKGGIFIAKSFFHANDNGVGSPEAVIRVLNSDGVQLKASTIDSGGAVLSVLFDGSDNNLVQKVTFLSNFADVFYGNGTGNCFRDNVSYFGVDPFTDPPIPLVDSCT